MPTHIICWGKVVFDLILNNPRYSVISRKDLKVFYPSMLQFGINDGRTHNILKTFFQVLR